MVFQSAGTEVFEMPLLAPLAIGRPNWTATAVHQLKSWDMAEELGVFFGDENEKANLWVFGCLWSVFEKFVSLR